MPKIAFVRLEHDDTVHRIPATDAKEEDPYVVICEGEKVMGRFERTRVQHWGLELAEEGSRLGARRDR